MKIEPKVRGFVCTTAHPAGCAENVRRQAEYVEAQPCIKGAKNVLVLGASAGYGLASRIVAAFGCGAATLGVIYDKATSGGRTASAGWYNTAAFEQLAAKNGLYAKSICGDAFLKETKDRTIDIIKKEMGKIDLIIYSLAAPRRTLADGSTVSSVLKTVGEAYTNKTIDLRSGNITEVTVPPADEDEINNTIRVMGGEDWSDWLYALKAADLLADSTLTVAYSYIGPSLTHPLYLNGTIGMAKRHLCKTAAVLSANIEGVQAYVSVNKALVTQASAAIPVVPLYIALLYRVMKAQKLHEGCIEQIYRLFSTKLYADKIQTDEQGLIRIDDREMKSEVQNEVNYLWNKINNENAAVLADIDGYWQDFYELFGFRVPNVDYGAEQNPNVSIPSISEEKT
ncbi:MAG: trans-2-enoyl-CoA reductase family protein [Hydrogenoanaerobacterium sp.]